jgi:hypothetical protein
VIPLNAYKVIHLLGMFMLFTVLGGIALHSLNGGTRQSNTGRRLIGAMHGISLFIILLGGFGMLARLGLVRGMLPGWILAKLAIWIALPFLGLMAYRKPQFAKLLLVVMPMLGGLAGWIALYKPF